MALYWYAYAISKVFNDYWKNQFKFNSPVKDFLCPILTTS